METIIDLETFPIHRLDSRDGKNLVRCCKSGLDFMVGMVSLVTTRFLCPACLGLP